MYMCVRVCVFHATTVTNPSAVVVVVQPWRKSSEKSADSDSEEHIIASSLTALGRLAQKTACKEMMHREGREPVTNF